MTLQEISDLLDEKLAPINKKIDVLQTDVNELKVNMKKVLAFVSTGNEDAVEKLPKLRRVKH